MQDWKGNTRTLLTFTQQNPCPNVDDKIPIIAKQKSICKVLVENEQVQQ